MLHNQIFPKYTDVEQDFLFTAAVKRRKNPIEVLFFFYTNAHTVCESKHNQTAVLSDLTKVLFARAWQQPEAYPVCVCVCVGGIQK